VWTDTLDWKCGLVRTEYNLSTLQAAHIGCGISGREGRAAVLASDFSFAQFR
jgi:hypothetical protein